MPKGNSIFVYMFCKVCARAIEQERIDVLGVTSFCAPCAQKLQPVKPRKGYMSFDHKTGGVLQTLSAEDYEKNKKYFVAYGARSAVKNFSKNVCA
jgi:hypothetical protein